MKVPEGELMYSSALSLTSALDWGGWSTPRPGRFTPGERHPVPIVREAGWVPGPVWTGAEILASNGIRSPGRPDRSESLYRMSCRSPLRMSGAIYNCSPRCAFTVCAGTSRCISSSSTVLEIIFLRALDQPLKVSTRDFSWGKGGQCVWLTTYNPCSAVTSRKSGALIYPEPLGPPQHVAGHL